MTLRLVLECEGCGEGDGRHEIVDGGVHVVRYCDECFESMETWLKLNGEMTRAGTPERVASHWSKVHERQRWNRGHE